MAKMQCACGKVLHITGESIYEYYLVQYNDISNIAEMLDKNEMDGDKFHSFIITKGNEVTICDNCERLYKYSFDRKNKKIYTTLYEVAKKGESDMHVDIVYNNEKK